MNKTDLLSMTDAPLYEERADFSEVYPYKNKVLLKKNAKVCLYGDRITVDDRTFRFSEVSAVVVLGKNKLNIYAGSELLQLKGSKRFNALKYVNFYHRCKNLSAGNPDDQFLGM